MKSGPDTLAQTAAEDAMEKIKETTTNDHRTKLVFVVYLFYR